VVPGQQGQPGVTPPDRRLAANLIMTGAVVHRNFPTRMRMAILFRTRSMTWNLNNPGPCAAESDLYKEVMVALGTRLTIMCTWKR
jgi:hypothetical protein